MAVKTFVDSSGVEVEGVSYVELKPVGFLTREQIQAAVEAKKLSLADALALIERQTELGKNPIKIGQSKKGCICVKVGSARMPASFYGSVWQRLLADGVREQILGFVAKNPITDAHKQEQERCRKLEASKRTQKQVSQAEEEAAKYGRPTMPASSELASALAKMA